MPGAEQRVLRYGAARQAVTCGRGEALLEGGLPGYEQGRPEPEPALWTVAMSSSAVSKSSDVTSPGRGGGAVEGGERRDGSGAPSRSASAGEEGGLLRLRLRRLVELSALVWVVLMAVVVLGRITFPLELEWMEGGSLHHALRLAQGEPIYAAPSIDFVPFLYTPLYPGLLALLAGLGLPLGLVLGRAVSVAAMAAIAVGLWRLVAAENKPRAHRAAAVGLFLAGYLVSFRWYDIARGDSMMFALLLWGVLLARNAGKGGGGWWRPLVGGLLVALAFWTKQSAAVLIFASGLAVIASGLRGRFWALARYTLTVAVVVLGGLWLGIAVTDGWLWTYIYELHQTHAFNHERFERKTWGMLLHAAPFLGLLALTLVSDGFGRLVARLRRSVGIRGHLSALFEGSVRAAGQRFWGVMAAFALLVSALGYSTQWAEPNAFIPAVIFGAAYLGVALPEGGRRESWALLLIAAQLLFAAAIEPMYQPIQDRGTAALGESYRWQAWRRTIPDAAAREAAAELRSELLSLGERAGEGELFALARPWWSVIGGGRGHVASMGISDVAKADGVRLRRELGAELRSGRFAEAWFEGEPPRWLRGALTRRFRLEERRLGAARVRPWSGYMSEAGMVTPYRAPQVRVLRTGPRSQPKGTTVLADFESRTMPPGFRRRGRAFSPRPHAAIVGDLPILGPHGGEQLIGSALGSAGLKATGSLESPVFHGSSGAVLELLVGFSKGDRRGLSITVEVLGGDGSSGGSAGDDTVEVLRRVALPLPKVEPWRLTPLRWEFPAEFVGQPLRLQIADESSSAAIFIDDLWICDGG